MFSVQRCSGRLLVQCVMYFLKQRLKVWQILEKKLKQNLEVVRSDLSKLKIATESAAGYVVYKPTSTKGPSIYDVHTEGGGGSGSGGRMWTEGGAPSPMRTSTQKIKIKV